MGWQKCNLWKASIVVAGVLLLLVLMAWVPVSAARAYQDVPKPITKGTVTVQATPTEDATVTALNKEKLTQEVDQQQRTLGNWLWSNAATIISSFLSALVVATGVLIGFRQWRVGRKDTQSKESEDRQAAQDKELKDRQDEREKRAEERFQAAVEGLSSERKEAKIGAAILLRTFLRPGYEQFYTQTFDLAVAHLCPTETPHPLEDPEVPLILTILRQALIMVFKEAFPLARSQNTGSPQSLDASYIQLDNAYLRGADLKQAWMPQASLREAYLVQAEISEAHLRYTNLSGARLDEAKLDGADLQGANLRGVYLSRTDLSGADLDRAHLPGAHLRGARLIDAKLNRADLSGADLSGAKLNRAMLNQANIEDARSLKDTDLRSISPLANEQREACKAKGAIIDEDSTNNPSQSTVSPPPPPQSSDAQTPSAPSSQGNISTPDTGGSSAASSQQDLQS